MIKSFALLGLFSLRTTNGNIRWTRYLASNPNTFVRIRREVNITAHFGCETLRGFATATFDLLTFNDGEGRKYKDLKSRIAIATFSDVNVFRDLCATPKQLHIISIVYPCS